MPKRGESNNRAPFGIEQARRFQLAAAFLHLYGLSRAAAAYTRSKLGIENTIQLRWLNPQHVPFLAWHRQKVFRC